MPYLWCDRRWFRNTGSPGNKKEGEKMHEGLGDSRILPTFSVEMDENQSGGQMSISYI